MLSQEDLTFIYKALEKTSVPKEQENYLVDPKLRIINILKSEGSPSENNVPG